MIAVVEAFIRAHIIDTDPDPQYSRLDQLDGLAHQLDRYHFEQRIAA